MCIQEHHVTDGKLDGAKTSEDGYVGQWDAASPPVRHGAKGGTAVLARTQITTCILDYPGTPLVPMARTGRVTACHVSAGPRGGSILVSTHQWHGEGCRNERNSDMMRGVAEWPVDMGRPSIWGGERHQAPPGQVNEIGFLKKVGGAIIAPGGSTLRHADKTIH